MSYRPIYTPIAFNEYKDAVEWYAARSNQAAECFVEAVKERLRLICEKPQHYRNTYKNFRETLLKKYPFYIIYFID
jgi:plasmid stabilization system protein ParE